MNNITDLHRAAMEKADEALSAKRAGDESQWRSFLREALDFEAKAAESAPAELEPTRTILFRSAALLARDCEDFEKAQSLLYSALSKAPPQEFRTELEHLLHSIAFEGKLRLRGVQLDEQEFQLSLMGDAVGFGIARTEPFLERVRSVEKMIYRMAERKLNRPYREQGRVKKDLQRSFELYVSVPRAASFSVSFRLGSSLQAAFPGIGAGEQIIDELFDCLNLFNRLDRRGLLNRIPEEAYYTNFVGLAKTLAPDGKAIRTVEFTKVREGTSTEVTLTLPQREVPPSLSIPSETSSDAKPVEVRGFLKHASALKKNENRIKIKPTKGKSVTLVVPEGLMDDIVRPMWDTEVTVQGRKEGNKVRLLAIERAEPA